MTMVPLVGLAYTYIVNVADCEEVKNVDNGKDEEKFGLD